jgi:hypothetical protein
VDEVQWVFLLAVLELQACESKMREHICLVHSYLTEELSMCQQLPSFDCDCELPVIDNENFNAM